MRYPEFFDRVPTLRLYDPLGDFLGAFEDGIVELGYLDCVKLAGHSCPTVAGAFILTSVALRRLYGPDELPVRSRITVELRSDRSDGVTGVIGMVAGYLCGAGDEGGFPGIGEHFSRRGLLRYGVGELEGEIRFTRIETDTSITLSLDTSAVAASPEMMPLMQKALTGEADESERRKFRELWQGRVEAMLTDPELWGRIAVVH
ncbi:FmdE family protein [Nitratifractor sp.]